MTDTSTPAPPSPRRRRRKNLDVGRAFFFPFRDPDWLVKLLVHGLLLLVPILGTIILQGWQREIFMHAREEEDELPEINIGKHLSDGLVPFAATFNVYLPYIAVVLLAQVLIMGGAFGGLIAREELNEPGLAAIGIVLSLVGYLIMFAAMLPMYAFLPEAQRRGFKGEPLPLIHFGPSVESLRAHPSHYLLACVFAFLFSFLGGIGIYLCCVGFFITMPWCFAATAHILGQYDRIVDPPAEPPEEDTPSEEGNGGGEDEGSTPDEVPNQAEPLIDDASPPREHEESVQSDANKE